jgi:mRNA-degrading endonuclease RelE of RelBE toxin-antitoxin system
MPAAPARSLPLSFIIILPSFCASLSQSPRHLDIGAVHQTVLKKLSEMAQSLPPAPRSLLKYKIVAHHPSLTYNISMVFIEIPIFTEDLLKLLSDDEYKEMQKALLLEPEKGDLIQGSGGFRKIRWKQGGKGKRGGVRVIYYWEKSTQKLYLIFIYKKSVQEDLTQAQIKLLKSLVKGVIT